MFDFELTGIESDWVSKLDKHMSKVPKGVDLLINRDSSYGNVEIFSQENMSFTRGQKTWITRLKNIIAEKPDTPEFWLLSNIDGLHVGKGYPTIINKSSYGVNGACSTHQDNFDEHYYSTFSVEYCEVEHDKYELCDHEEIETCVGDFKIWQVGDFGKRLSP